ncbi:hypothetical protein WN51_09893 [Melipona quadrifasciata]|uniref:Uncharacterized protein n=1 Tax=Melipona quadrifasciata TaxID=166423 RepID=A0A0M9AA56_9HYME|nr:hypothetical protein WN51_09893 [Melipona quadrifasciata]
MNEYCGDSTPDETHPQPGCRLKGEFEIEIEVKQWGYQRENPHFLAGAKKSRRHIRSTQKVSLLARDIQSAITTQSVSSSLDTETPRQTREPQRSGQHSLKNHRRAPSIPLSTSEPEAHPHIPPHPLDRSSQFLNISSSGTQSLAMPEEQDTK